MGTQLQLSLLLTSVFLTACDDAPKAGTLEISIYGEEFIEEGIPEDAFIDEWSVTFDRFEVTVGNVSAGSGNLSSALTQNENQTFDLTQATSGQGQLVASGPVAGGAYNHISYRIVAMQVEGTATKDAVTKTFSWTFDTQTLYSECEGTAVVDGNTQQTQLTIHADHLFYDDLVSSEPNVAFDIIASADENGDDDVTQAELLATDITGEDRYQVGNDTDVTDLWSFMDRQSSTVGHIDGEGHCGTATRE